MFLAAATPAAAQVCTLGKFADLPVTMQGLTPTVPAKIDGVDVKLIADSGSFFSLLTPAAAAKASLRLGAAPPGFDSVVGLGGAEPARMATAQDFTLFGYTFHHADFVVAAGQLGGEDVDGLLGDNVLSFADVEFDLAHGAIRLFKAHGCDHHANFAYWAAASDVETADIDPPSHPSNQITVHVKINGREMTAVLDSGSPRSFITQAAARSVGVSVDDPGAMPSGMGGGIGHRSYRTWTARFDSVAIGDEQVKNTMLHIVDTRIGAASSGAEMLLGADFLLSHRVYVANSVGKLYFTYLGGPVFDFDGASAPGPAAPHAPLVAGHTSDDELRASIASDRADLQLADRAQHPSAWARAQVRLANDLTGLGARGDDSALREAAATLRSAMEIWTRDSEPGEWMLLQSDLGEVLGDIGVRGDDQALRDAVAAFRASLTLLKPQPLFKPGLGYYRWMLTQTNFANVLFALGQRGDKAAQDEALAAYGAVLDTSTSPSVLVPIARGQRWLILGERGDLSALHKAVAEFRADLQASPRETEPYIWASTQGLLGEALHGLGERGDATARSDAVAAYRAALDVVTRDHDPGGWAELELRLADALLDLGEHGDNAELTEAAAAYRSALEVLPPGQTDSASAAAGLGRAQTRLAAGGR